MFAAKAQLKTLCTKKVKPMTFLEIFSFFMVTAIAGAVNAVAGGGTFLTFPLFTFFGLTPLQANVMSTIALWPGTISSTFGYRNVAVDRKKILPFLLVCVVGGAVGSLTLLATPAALFAGLVPWLLLGATLIFTFGRSAITWLHRRFPDTKEKPAIGMTFQALVAFYGGYFGAGIGILTLALLQMMGMQDIHQMNALKTMLAAAINAATVVVFVVAGAVMWKLAFVMIAGGVFGGYVGARLALKIHPGYVRKLVSAIGFVMTAYFFIK